MLHQILRPFMLRRTKEDVDLSIPPKKEVLIYVKLNQFQRQIYQNILLKKPLTENSCSNLSAILMQLRKVCLHPYLFDGVEEKNLDTFGEHLITNCSKLSILDKLLARLKGEHKVLIFS